MIEALRHELASAASVEDKTNRAREFLQILALKSLSDQDAFSRVAFIGGTALRVIFGLRRFSEDLDFSIVSSRGYDFSDICGGLAKAFRSNGLDAGVDKQNERTVNAAFLSFPGLPHALGLSGHKGEKLSIKIEVDRRPPAGWKTQANRVKYRKDEGLGRSLMELSTFASRLVAPLPCPQDFQGTILPRCGQNF